jgi:hypothetical protein
MDPLTVTLATLGTASLVGLAWLGGYEWGCANGITAERENANRRVRGLLDTINTRPPSKAAKNRRKAARKAVRA